MNEERCSDCYELLEDCFCDEEDYYDDYYDCGCCRCCGCDCYLGTEDLEDG